MGSKNSVPAPTDEDLAVRHAPLDLPFSDAVFTNENPLHFIVPREAWTQGAVIEGLGGLRVVPDPTAEFYQGSRCSLYLQDTCVAVLLSYDSIRIRVCTLLPPSSTSRALPDQKHEERPLYEYAVITKKRDSRQHVLHLTALPRQASNGLQQRLVTAKLQKSSHYDRVIHPFEDKTDVWAAVYEQSKTTWRVQTAVGVDPILVLAFCLGTDRFVRYVEDQHLRRTATLDSTTQLGTIRPPS